MTSYPAKTPGSPYFSKVILQWISLLLPAFFLFGLMYFKSSHFFLKECLSNCLIISACFFAVNIISIRWLRIILMIILVITTYSTLFFESAYFQLYQSRISESTIYILIETNFTEAGDFFSMYFDTKLLFISIVFFIFLIISIFILSRKEYTVKKTQQIVLATCALILWLVTGLYKKNVFYIAYQSVKIYKSELSKYRSSISEKNGGIFSEVMHADSSRQIYVLVIGESTTRHHMSLYGYYRNTNPMLTSLSNQLEVFTDVISPHTHTIYSLEKMLTLSDAEGSYKPTDGSLIQLMNKAGFSTYWISNQNPIGANETLVTTLAKATHHSYFINTAGWKANTPYDEQLFVPLDKVLSDTARKKFIILHLMGTHAVYARRYPASFKRFSDRPVTKFPGEKNIQVINNYDNAVLYNDYVIASLIDRVKQQAAKSWLLYVSDHGEDVYETQNAASHQEVNGSKPMYDVPCILWRSEKYKASDSIHSYDTKRKYMLDDLIYSVADLSNISFKQFQSSRSVVNRLFLYRNRIIGKNENYDLKFIR